MRLFYAVTFDEDVRRRLAGLQEALWEQTVRGSFTLLENLHLTLAFIGEVPPVRAAPLIAIAKEFRLTPFPLRITGIGSYRREGGSIVWAGVEDGGGLAETHKRLAGQIAAAGFKLEDRRFTPHLTLAREVRFREGFELRAFPETAPIGTTVRKVSLMLSERRSGRLVYTEV